MINQQLSDIEHLSPGGTLSLAFIPSDSAGNVALSKEIIKSFSR